MTIVRRVAVDVARRTWWIYVVGTGVISINALLARDVDGEQIRSIPDLLAWALAVSWFLAAAPIPLAEARELTMLPVSRRQFWMARWWLSVAGPAATLAAALAIGSVVPGAGFGVNGALMVISLGVLYAGCFTALNTLVALPINAVPGRRRTIGAVLYFLVIPMGGAVAPFWFAAYLPITFTGLSTVWAGALIAAAALTIASYFYHPKIGARSNRRLARSSSSAATSRLHTSGGLNGVPLLFFREARKVFVLCVAYLVVALAYWWMFEAGPKAIGQAVGLRNLADFFQAGGTLIFANLAQPIAGQFPTAVILMGTATSEIGLAAELRGLRALPMSVARLSAIVTGLGVMAIAVMWVFLIAVHLLALGQAPQSLRPDLLFALSGTISLSVAVRLMLPGSNGMKMLAAIVVMIPAMFLMLWAYVTPESIAVRAAMIAGGGAGLVISWLFNLRTLRRGHRVYKPQTPFVLTSS